MRDNFFDLTHARTKFNNWSRDLRIEARSNQAVEVVKDRPQHRLVRPRFAVSLDLDVVLFER